MANQPKELNDLRKEYVQKVIEWIEEQAKNPDVDEISVKLSYNEFEDYYPSELKEVNGWQCDYWKEPVEIAGRNWRVSGCGMSGTVDLYIEED